MRRLFESLALRGLGARKLRGRADRIRDPARGRDGRRHLHAEGLARQRLRRHLRRGERRHRRHRSAEARLRQRLRHAQSGVCTLAGSWSRSRRGRRCEAGRRRDRRQRQHDRDPRRQRRPDRPVRRRPAVRPERRCPSRSTRSPGPREGRRPATIRSRSTRSPPTRRTTRSARRSRSAAARRQGVHALGHRPLRLRRSARRRQPRRLHRRGGAAITGKGGEFDDNLDVEAADGVSPERALGSDQPPSCRRTSRPRPAPRTRPQQSADIKDGFGFLTTALLVFAGISVFVGAFLIFNTFSITVAQRTKEFGMLRTLGASSRQVLGERDRRGSRPRDHRLAPRDRRSASASSSSSPAVFKGDRLRAAAVGDRGPARRRSSRR